MAAGRGYKFGSVVLGEIRETGLFRSGRGPYSSNNYCKLLGTYPKEVARRFRDLASDL